MVASPKSFENENKLLASVERGELLPFYIVHSSDDFLASKLAEKIAQKLVPEKDRSLNLVRYEGDESDLNTIFADINSYAFFPGRKVVWVRGLNLAAAKTDISAPLKAALSSLKQGKETPAAKSLAIALNRAGQDPSKLVGVSSAAAAEAIKSALGSQLTAAEIKQLSELSAIYAEKPKLAESSDDSPLDTISAAVAKGWPKEHILVVSSPKLDMRSKQVKALSEKGVVFHLQSTAGGSDFYGGGDDAALDLVNSISREKGLNMTAAAAAAFVSRVDAANSRLVESELEKLAAYVNVKTATPEDIEAVTIVTREDPHYELVNSFAERKYEEALIRLQNRFGGEEKAMDEALQFLGALAAEFRRLLKARLVIDSPEGRGYSPSMSFPQFTGSIANRLPQGGCEITGGKSKPKPGYLIHIFKRAHSYSTEDLKRALIELHSLDRKLKSSAQHPRQLFELFLFKLCAKR